MSLLKLLGWADGNPGSARLAATIQTRLGSLSPTRAVVVHNDSFGSGCASSLLAGLDASGDDCAAIMLLLGDMPGVDSGLIDSVLEQWRDAPSWAAVTSYKDRLGHPMNMAVHAVEDDLNFHDVWSG